MQKLYFYSFLSRNTLEDTKIYIFLQSKKKKKKQSLSGLESDVYSDRFFSAEKMSLAQATQS